MEQQMPLENVKVIDCALLLAGPWTATLLGDYGAEVIKIEHPEFGDPVRQHTVDGKPLYWKSLARNKKSVPVDLKDPEGKEVIKELVKDADVFIENFRPGTLEQWGLGWETLSEINPDLVMTRVTGFGQTGPYKDRPGFGTLAEAMSGFAYKTGQEDGPPTLPPFGLADAISALCSTWAIMFALYWRDVEGGSGQYIDSTIIEPIFNSLMQRDVVEYAEAGIVRERQGNTVPETVVPRNAYQTKDSKWVAISASTESIARRVLRIIGGEELAEDPRYHTLEERKKRHEEVDEMVADWMAEHTREEVLDIFEEYEAAIAPVYSIEGIFEDEHFQARDDLIEVTDDEYGDITMAGVIPKLSETPGRVRETGPEFGEHTMEVLGEQTSLDDDTIQRLVEDGVLRVHESGE